MFLSYFTSSSAKLGENYLDTFCTYRYLQTTSYCDVWCSIFNIYSRLSAIHPFLIFNLYTFHTTYTQYGAICLAACEHGLRYWYPKLVIASSHPLLAISHASVSVFLVYCKQYSLLLHWLNNIDSIWLPWHSLNFCTMILSSTFQAQLEDLNTGFIIECSPSCQDQWMVLHNPQQWMFSFTQSQLLFHSAKFLSMGLNGDLDRPQLICALTYWCAFWLYGESQAVRVWPYACSWCMCYHCWSNHMKPHVQTLAAKVLNADTLMAQ